MKKLFEQRASKQAQMETILAAVKTEERAMNEEERATFDTLEADIRSIDATIAAMESKRTLDEATPVVGEEPDVDTRSIEEREIEAFENFVRNNQVALRSGEIQLTQALNGKVVPTTIANKIIKAVRDRVPFLQKADVVYTNGTFSVPVYGEDSTNYINADYVDEGSALTDNIGKFTTVDLKGYVIGALSLVSNKLIDNTDINITEFVVNQVADAIATKLEKEFVVGTSNKITGILSGDVAVTTAGATAITYDELVTLKHSLKKQFRQNGVWVMNDSTYTTLCKLKDSNGQPYFKDDEYKILGCDVLVSDSMPAVATGNKTIVFADLSGYTIKATKSVEVKILREKYADRNMIGIIAYAEYDAKITDAKKIAVLQQA